MDIDWLVPIAGNFSNVVQLVGVGDDVSSGRSDSSFHEGWTGTEPLMPTQKKKNKKTAHGLRQRG